MRKRNYILAVVAAIVLLLALPALAAPKRAYTAQELEDEIANGNLQKLWANNAGTIYTLKDGSFVDSGNCVSFGEAVYVEDATPVNGYVLVYTYAWGYTADGELACNLKAVGYIPARSMQEEQPKQQAAASGSGCPCSCVGRVANCSTSSNCGCTCDRSAANNCHCGSNP